MKLQQHVDSIKQARAKLVAREPSFQLEGEASIALSASEYLIFAKIVPISNERKGLETMKLSEEVLRYNVKQSLGPVEIGLECFVLVGLGTYPTALQDSK